MLLLWIEQEHTKKIIFKSTRGCCKDIDQRTINSTAAIEKELNILLLKP